MYGHEFSYGKPRSPRMNSGATVTPETKSLPVVQRHVRAIHICHSHEDLSSRERRMPLPPPPFSTLACSEVSTESTQTLNNLFFGVF